MAMFTPIGAGRKPADFNRMLERMACPVCKGFPLEPPSSEKGIIRGKIICPNCNRNYAIFKGIPIMLPDQLRNKKTLEKANWNRWQRRMGEFNRAMEEWTEENSRETIPAWEDIFYDFCSIEGSVLDIGSGCGIARHFLGQVDYWGIDPEDWINAPKLKFPIEEMFPCLIRPFPFILAVGEYLPFRNESFENVLIISALDHTNSPHQVFKEAYRVLKKGGQIVLSTYCFKAGYKEKPRISHYFRKGARDILEGNFRELKSRIIRSLTHMPDFYFNQDDIRKLFGASFQGLKSKNYKGNEWFFKARKNHRENGQIPKKI